MPRASTEPKKKSKGLTLSLNKSSKTVLSGKVKVKLPRQLSTARGPSNPRGPRGDTTLDHIHDVYQPSLEQMESLRSRGAVIRTTRWTPDEIAVLEKNIEAVLKARKADDLSILLESLEKGSEEALDVKRHLSTGIDRPVQQVLRRINRDMVETKHIVYSKEDNTKLMQLSKLHGNDYTKIGELMGRNWCSVRDRLRRANATTVGPWTLEEESKLIKAVLKKTKRPATDLIQLNVPWDAVAKKVGTRQGFQCHKKWVVKLAWMTCAKARGVSSVWTKADDVALVEHVAAHDKVMGAIDWHVVSETFPGTIRTSAALKIIWEQSVARQFKAGITEDDDEWGDDIIPSPTKAAADDEVPDKVVDAETAPEDGPEEDASGDRAAQLKRARKLLKKRLGRKPTETEIAAQIVAMGQPSDAGSAVDDDTAAPAAEVESSHLESAPTIGEKSKKRKKSKKSKHKRGAEGDGGTQAQKKSKGD